MPFLMGVHSSYMDVSLYSSAHTYIVGSFVLAPTQYSISHTYAIGSSVLATPTLTLLECEFYIVDQ